MAKAPRAFGLGPLETIVGVEFPAGCWLLVTVRAEYQHAGIEPGTKQVSIELTPAGQAAGGRIFGQKTFHRGSNPDVEPTYTLFRAVLRFSRTVKNTLAAFRIKLKGTGVFTDTSVPPPTATEFCGTTTFTASGSAYYAKTLPGSVTPSDPDGQQGLFQDVIWNGSSPSGSGAITWTYQVADVTLADVGKGAYASSGSTSEIWYIDAFGNYFNTHRDCSELLPPGSPTVAQRVDGFDHINVNAYPYSMVKPADVSKWTIDTPDNQIMVPTSKDKFNGNAQYLMTVPQRIVGLNNDFQPIFTDLGDGNYDFSLTKFAFSNVPAPKGKRYTTFASIPLAPATVKYRFFVVDDFPSLDAFRPPKEPVPGTSPPLIEEKLWPVAVSPPSDQVFQSMS